MHAYTRAHTHTHTHTLTIFWEKIEHRKPHAPRTNMKLTNIRPEMRDDVPVRAT